MYWIFITETSAKDKRNNWEVYFQRFTGERELQPSVTAKRMIHMQAIEVHSGTSISFKPVFLFPLEVVVIFGFYKAALILRWGRFVNWFSYSMTLNENQ